LSMPLLKRSLHNFASFQAILFRKKTLLQFKEAGFRELM